MNKNYLIKINSINKKSTGKKKLHDLNVNFVMKARLPKIENVHIEFLNLQFVVILERRNQKQAVLGSSECSCMLTAADAFSYPLTTGICIEARHSEFCVNKT